MRKNAWKKALALCAAAGMAWLDGNGRARADLSVSIPATQDVTLFGGATDTANNSTSSGPGMFVGTDGTSKKRGIIEFSAASISAALPPGATITSATLTMYLGMVGGGDTTPRAIQIFDMTTAWNGSTLGTTGFPSGFSGTGQGFSPPNTGDATWTYAQYPTVMWTTAGGGGDFVSTASATETVSQTLKSAYTWSSAQMLTDVDNWLSTPSTDDGWLLENESEGLSVGDFRAFYTKEGAAEQSLPLLAPSLTLTFTVVPEPASLMLLAVGIPMLAARRNPARRRKER